MISNVFVGARDLLEGHLSVACCYVVNGEG